MKFTQEKTTLIVSEVRDFDIAQTLECGQCFHFEKLREMEYGVVYKKNLLHIKQEGDKLYCFDTDEETFQKIWMDYFDLERNYAEIKQILVNSDERLTHAIKVNSGVRILNQDFTETLLSFIISQNKQIPHIRKIVRELSEKYGDFLGELSGIQFYAFPDEEQIANITEENYRECKTGFRAPYLLDAGKKLQFSEYTTQNLKQAGYDEAKKILMQIKGVGEKVANCVLLFALGYRNAFPVDVWIKRIMEEMYFEDSAYAQTIMKFAREKFGDYGGYAQQYLFYYAREKGIGKEKN